MATGTMATVAGAAAILYYALNKRAPPSIELKDDSDDNGSPSSRTFGNRRVSHRLLQAPGTWLETISTLSETLRFTYSETLGKWPIGELAFGIHFLLKRQGNLRVRDVFGGPDSVQLTGVELQLELQYMLNLLTLCWHFSKKPFPLFLKETGYSEEDVLLHEPKAGILKPAFTILVDHKKKCFLLLIRGTHSIKDTLTAVTGAVVPFHHTVVDEAGVNNLVLGYAHCGMVAAARWIAKLANPCLTKALAEYPGYNLKIVGHSLGGGTAALLTYVMREQKDWSKTTCLTFAPAACMTWELAESGKDFITSVINGADLVPTFSAASLDDLRAEVTASAWLNDLRGQIERTRILSTVYRSATALGSRLPTIASAKTKVAGAGAILRPVSNSTQVVMKRAQTMARAAWARPALPFSSWSCMGPRYRASATRSNAKEEDSDESPSSQTEQSESLMAFKQEPTLVETIENPSSSTQADEWRSQHEADSSADGELDNKDILGHDRHEDRMTEFELWQQLEKELEHGSENEDTEEMEKEIREEEAAAMAEVSIQPHDSIPETKEVHRFFPPGKTMHIVDLKTDEEEESANESSNSDDSDSSQLSEPTVGIFLTHRSLYGKLRLSQTMIKDHIMPVYRRQMEKLLEELKME
uniref:Sn1-specific diacylglycerol lipase alpha n=1 Tax=Kalanchoe fedtschenkoi TaxID=63787 RepID=A0A7N0VBH1_KALFE